MMVAGGYRLERILSELHMSEIATDAPQRTRRRRRGGEQARKSRFWPNSFPGARQPISTIRPAVDAEGVEAIHEASMRILEEIGICS